MYKKHSEFVLNCIIEEFKKSEEYFVIITVPTRTLVSQRQLNT